MTGIPRVAAVAAVMVALATGACTGSSSHPPAGIPSASGVVVATTPPEHVVVVVFENKADGEILGSGHAPTFDSLARSGARFTESYAITHPSQPNYLALFSGGTQDVSSDACPLTFHGTPNLGAQLLASGRTFVGYSEGLPSSGFTGCRQGRYARKHSPWVNFANLPASVNQPYTAFPADYASLPTVSFVIPDLCDDMHDCPPATGDAWLRQHIAPYADWAMTHHSLLIVTFDEDDTSSGNRIATFAVGQDVVPGEYPQRIDHYTMLRTMEACLGLAPIGRAAERDPLPQLCPRR